MNERPGYEARRAAVQYNSLDYFFGVFLEVLTAAHNDYLVMGVYVCVCTTKICRSRFSDVQDCHQRLSSAFDVLLFSNPIPHKHGWPFVNNFVKFSQQIYTPILPNRENVAFVMETQ